MSFGFEQRAHEVMRQMATELESVLDLDVLDDCSLKQESTNCARCGVNNALRAYGRLMKDAGEDVETGADMYCGKRPEARQVTEGKV